MESYGSLITPTCVVCQDVIIGTSLYAPCGHVFDVPCLTEMYQNAVRDETLFPPRCCGQTIHIRVMQQHLNPALVDHFTQKTKELATLDRVYCSSPTCSRFLDGRSRGVILDCPGAKCSTRTCGWCKGRVGGRGWHICKEDSRDAQVLAFSRGKGWASCPGCGQIIELNTGCFHITCRCKTQFCYLCTARWKNCACPQFEDPEVIQAAEERVRQTHGQLGMRNSELVRETIAQVRLVRSCGHGQWVARWGKGRSCHTCYHRQVYRISVSRQHLVY